MSIFKKIMTAIRGGASEVGEASIDSNATRICEKEIRNAESHFTKDKRDINRVMDEKKRVNRAVDRAKRNRIEAQGTGRYALEQRLQSSAVSIDRRREKLNKKR